MTENPVVQIGDIWYTPSYGGEEEYYELILVEWGRDRFYVLNLLTGQMYDAGVGVYRDAVRLA